MFRAEDPSRCGVVEIDQSSLVTGFSEKPAQPVGNLANAGMYAFIPPCFSRSTTRLPAISATGFSRDWLDGHAP